MPRTLGQIKIERHQNVERIADRIMNKIKGLSKLETNETITKVWRFDGRPVHAGQIQGIKILPNGNKQIRVTTVYAGTTPSIATDTRVFSPSGELLNAYHGIRGAEKTISPTRNYGNTPSEVSEIIKLERSINPEVRYLPT